MTALGVGLLSFDRELSSRSLALSFFRFWTCFWTFSMLCVHLSFSLCVFLCSDVAVRILVSNEPTYVYTYYLLLF